MRHGGCRGGAEGAHPPSLATSGTHRHPPHQGGDADQGFHGVRYAAQMFAHPVLDRPDLEHQLGRAVPGECGRVDEHHQQQHCGHCSQHEPSATQAVQASGQPVDQRHCRQECDADHEVAEPLDLDAHREAGDTQRTERGHQQGQDDLADGGQEGGRGSRGEDGQARREHCSCRGGSRQQRWPFSNHGSDTDPDGEHGGHGRRSATTDGQSDGEQDSQCGRQRLVYDDRYVDDSEDAQTNGDDEQGEHPRPLQRG